MQQLAIEFLPSLISKPKSGKKRAKHVINLGITDQKVHQHKRTSICGNQGLSLILTSTNQTHMPYSACASLGKFLLWVVLHNFME